MKRNGYDIEFLNPADATTDVIVSVASDTKLVKTFRGQAVDALAQAEAFIDSQVTFQSRKVNIFLDFEITPEQYHEFVMAVSQFKFVKAVHLV